MFVDVAAAHFPDFCSGKETGPSRTRNVVLLDQFLSLQLGTVHVIEAHLLEPGNIMIFWAFFAPMPPPHGAHAE